MTALLVFDPPYQVRRSIGDGLRIDYAGFGLLALGLGSLEVVLDQGQREDWFSSNFIVVFSILTVLALVAVVFWELRQEHPIIDFHVLKERNFTLATVAMLIMGFVLYGSTTLMPLFLQTLLGYTAMLSGLVLSPGGLAVCVCMPVVGLLLKKYEARWLVVFGVLVSAAGLLMMSRFNLDVDYGSAVRARVVQSFGLGFLFVPISVAAFARVPRERTNYATGLFNLARNIGGSSGIATITTLLARRAQVHQQTLVAHLTPYDRAFRDSLANTAAMVRTRGAGLAGADAQAQGLIYGGMLRQANMLSFADAFLVMAVLFLAIVPLMFFMRKAGPTKGPVMVE